MITGYALYYSPCKRVSCNWHHVAQLRIHNALRERENTVPRPSAASVVRFFYLHPHKLTSSAAPAANKDSGPA